MKIYRYSFKALLIFNFLIFVRALSYSQEVPPHPTSRDSSAVNLSDSLSSARTLSASLWKIKSGEINDLIAEDIVDHVKILPNVFSLDLGSTGQFSPLIFRAATLQEGSVLIDDLIFEDPINGFLNSNIVPINFVEGIVYQGAGAFAPFGVQALSGAFQVNTFHFKGSQPYSKVILRAGDFGYSDIGVIFGLPVTQSISFLIGGNRQEFDGFTFNAGHGGSRIHAKILYNPNEDFSMKYSAFSNKDKVEIPAPLLPDLVPATPNGKRKENRLDHIFSLKLGNLLQNNNQFQGKIFISRLLQETSGDSLLFKNRNISFGIGLQHNLIAGNHWFTFGGEIKLHDLNSARLGDRSDSIGHVFVRDVYRFVKNWALGIQARLEKHDDYSIALQPSGQLSYEVSPLSTLWFAVQSARRYPSFAERYWPTQVFRGDPNLIEEKGTAFEIGFRMNK
ncbi:MAG: TonB-dependent receptor plug domain-containing protein, partial [bacterium]